MVTHDASVTLERRLGLRHAISTNVLGMIGIGPFLTIPYMLKAMNGPHILYAWILGGVLALCDGLVYAQLGAALPGSGGPYVYLREAYAPFGLGRMMSFLFIFMVLIVTPLGIASGAVGFADYLGFFVEYRNAFAHNAVAGGLCVVMTVLLYRNIESVARLGLVMLSIVFITVGWVIVVGLFNFSPAQAFNFPPEALQLNGKLVTTTGAAALLAMYTYGGYNNVCNIAEEIRDPRRVLPQSIVFSVILVMAIYIVMSIVMIGVIPCQEAQSTRTIASEFMIRAFDDPASGRTAATVINALILVVTASSLYAIILGYSRIPFAAARDGQFFRVFAKLHPTKHFPHVSVASLGLGSILFCFFSLGRIVNWLMLIQILIQYIWQCAGVILIARYRKDIEQPFRMWLYPIPAIVALGMWLYVFFTAREPGTIWYEQWAGQLFAVGYLLCGVIAFWIFRRGRPNQAHLTN